jgi:hypothetical protein
MESVLNDLQGKTAEEILATCCEHESADLPSQTVLTKHKSEQSRAYNESAKDTEFGNSNTVHSEVVSHYGL